MDANALAALNQAVSVAASTLGSMKNLSDNKKLMALQQEYNVQNWKMQNEYNSPFNQVGRLKEAGLNPALALGGNITNTNANTPTSSVSSGVNTDYAGAVSKGTQNAAAMQQMQLNKAQIENVEADTQNKQSQDEYLRNKGETERWNILQSKYDYMMKQLDYHIKNKSSQYIIDTYKKNVDKLAEEIDNIQSGTALNNANTYNATLETQKKFYEVYGAYVENNLIKPLQVKLLKSQISLNQSQKILNAAMASLNNANAATINAMRPYQLQQAANAIDYAAGKYGIELFESATGGNNILGTSYRLLSRLLRTIWDTAANLDITKGADLSPTMEHTVDRVMNEYGTTNIEKYKDKK